MRELHYCVKELQKTSRRLRVLSKMPDDIISIFPSLNFKVRINFVNSALIIRKMQEIHQLPQIDNYKIPVIRYPYLNANEAASQTIWATDYDSANYEKETVELRKICNSLIHSYVYDVLYQIDKNKKSQYMAYVGVASDYDKEKHVYVVAIKDWIDCLLYLAKI